MAKTEAQKASTRISRDKTYKQINVAVRYDSGMVDALDDAQIAEGCTAPAYILKAVKHQLIRDGYLQTPYTED